MPRFGGAFPFRENTMTTMLRDYPHLPVIPLGQCLHIFDQAQINFNQLSKLTGYSRMSLYNWRRGTRVPLTHALDRVSTLAHKVALLVASGVLPLPPRSKLERLKALIDGTDLTDFTITQ
jgi:hypothetical protein